MSSIRDKLSYANVMATVAVFLAACLGDLATYMTTSAQLAWAFPDPVGGFVASFAKFAGIFALTQLPIAISEGLLTVQFTTGRRGRVVSVVPGPSASE